MSDKIQQSIANLFRIQKGNVKQDGSQSVTKEGESLWSPVADFFKETETEKIIRKQGLGGVINSYEHKIQEIKNVFPDEITGTKINLLG